MRLIVTLGVAALLAASGGCAQRPLPGEGEIDPMPGGQAGACGADAQRLELVGSPLLALDNPPVNGNLYTTLLWTGDEYLFIWRVFGGNDVLMQRIDASGQGVGGNIRVRPFESACDFTWSAGRLGAVWPSGSSDAARQLMFQTFDRLGRPLIDPVVLRSAAPIPTDGGVTYGPRILPVADGFAITWSEEQVLVAIVNVDGKLRHGPAVAGQSELRSPRLGLAVADDGLLVGWAGPRPPEGPGVSVEAVEARAFSSRLEPLGPTISLDRQAFPGGIQFLATGSGYLALWAHDTPGDLQVRVAQIDAGGVGASIGRMAPPVDDAYRELAPAAWNGDHMVVLWDDRPSGTGGLTLSRHAPGGTRQGVPLALPTASLAGRFYVTAHDGMVGFIWSEGSFGGYQVYFQQARPTNACP